MALQLQYHTISLYNLFFETNNISTDRIVAVGFDGTVVNTSQKGCAIRMFEEKLQRPVRRIICLLHGNYLPLRHLIQNLEGKTTGPVGFTRRKTTVRMRKYASGKI